MNSILRATAILSSGSVVSILVSLVSSKVWAVLLGANGLGYMGLLQSLVGLAALVAGMGVTSGLIRAGANALGNDNYTRLAALKYASWWLLAVFGGIALLVMVMLRVPISELMLGGPEHADSVVLMSVAVIFTLASSIQTGTLNAHHHVVALAKLGVANSLVGTALSIAIVAVWRERGIPVALIVSSITGSLLAGYYLRMYVPPAAVRPERAHVVKCALELVRFGAPYTLSMVVGTGVQLILPALVLNNLDQASVGYYRAATAISVSYLGFLLVAMGQDYYPRISAVSDKPKVLADLVNQQQRLVLVLALPMILGTIALAPFIVSLIYLPEFAPAVAVLEWQLIGDLLKFSSWTMSYVILARSGSLVYFFTELIGGATTLGASLLGMRLFGLAGVGIGFLCTYIVYYAVSWAIVRKDIHLVWTRENVLRMVLALAAVAVLRLLPFAGLESVRTPLALVFAAVAGVSSLSVIIREVRSRRVESVELEVESDLPGASNSGLPARISVLIPSYRHEQYVAQTLDSVLAQTRQPDEILVINDGSPDNTTAAVQPYLDRITYIERPNLGLVPTMNQGIQLCSGDYILMIASDDWLEPNAIERMAAILDADAELGMVYGGTTVVDEHGNPHPEMRHSLFPVGKHRDIRQSLAANFVSSPGVLCRKQAVVDAGLFPNHLYCQDWALWLEIMLHGWYLYGLNRPVAFYRRHSHNLTSARNDVAARLDEIKMLEGIYKRYGSILTEDQRKTLFATTRRLLMTTGWVYLGMEDQAAARPVFMQALRRKPGEEAARGLFYSLLPKALYRKTRRLLHGLRRS